MAHSQYHKKVGAEVSLRRTGVVYVGVEARERLGIGYNDGVRVSFPQENGEDIVVSGHLDSAHNIRISRATFERVKKTGETTRTIHRDAIVEPLARSWDDQHDLTENRFDGYDRLDCE